MAESRATRAVRVALLVAAVLVTGIDTVGPQSAVAQVQPDSPTTSVVPETTSTLPTGGELGNIVPKPNSGREPETPGDPGGSQQVALFFVLCFVIAAMVGFMWWRSRVARARRAAEGRDPVRVATEHGGDVRKPRPPGIVD
jgi:hypothetical protein